uniref:Rust transferred protein n=1 Tax=Uromyces striatus TaxID=136422 RepID=Q334H5_9BASI|nr:rust transferred protein [Uromyces striatus]
MLFNPNLRVFLTIIILAAVARALTPGVVLVRTHHETMGLASVSICRAEKDIHLGHPNVRLRKRDMDKFANTPQHSKLELEDAKDSNYLSKATPSSPSLTTVDLTPAKLKSSCYLGTFQAPLLEDCEVVIRAQLYNSTGSLQASPGDYVFVSYGTCATVFQNPQNSNYTIQYNWAELGYLGGKLAGRCLLPEDHSMGGTAVFDTYLGHTYPDVIISLQRFDDRDFIIPE